MRGLIGDGCIPLVMGPLPDTGVCRTKKQTNTFRFTNFLKRVSMFPLSLHATATTEQRDEGTRHRTSW